MSEQDELAALLKRERWKRVTFRDEEGRPDYGMFEQTDEEVAAALLAAGWRRAKTVTTAEELAALPDWSIVVCDWGALVKSRAEETCWASTAGTFAFSNAALARNVSEPVRVVYVPGVEE